MVNKKFWIIFFSIFCIGITLRFLQLGVIPNSLNWDEVSFGYNAYSVLQTGKDEYGMQTPFTFRAFGEVKQPLYAYLNVLSIYIFGVTPFAVRFPSALFGSVTIIFVYLLTYELFRKEKHGQAIALSAMFFFAVCPWAIQFSRAAFEANVALSFIILGVWLFLRGLTLQKKYYFFLALIPFFLSMFTYLNAKVFVPVIIGLLLFYGNHYVEKQKKFFAIFTISAVVLVLLTIIDTSGLTRGRSVLFTANNDFLTPSLAQADYDAKHNDQLGMIFHNRRFVYGMQFVENYLNHFNPVWLFVSGDNPRHHAPDVGLLYVVNVPFILIAIIALARKINRLSVFVFAWLLFAPVVSSLTIDSPHALRSIIFLPVWNILEAIGWITVFNKLRDYPRFSFIKILLILLLLFNILYFAHQYFVHTNTNVEKEWLGGYKQAVERAAELKDKRVAISNSFEQGYIFYIFYNRVDPKQYLQEGGSTKRKLSCYSIDQVLFGSCDDKLQTGDYYISIGTYNNVSFKEKEIIHDLPGEDDVILYEKI